MENIKDKIAKLLALSDSPNENEAKAALLKARELMAQHKLRPEECVKAENLKVIRELIGVSVSKTKYHWAVDLSATIASHYCCRAYRNHVGGERTYNIGLVGLEDDFEICKRIFLYAFDCIKTRADEIFKENPYYSVAYRRSLSEAYGYGFVRGIASAFKRQEEEKEQEWGLVMVVPKEVNDAMSDMGKGKAFQNANMRSYRDSRAYSAAGFSDGEKFDPTSRIENSCAARPALCV